MGADFATRGARTDEIISILRTCWDIGSSEHSGEHYQFPNVKIAPPPPNRPIPIWVAGTAAPAVERAIRSGDGYHGLPTRRETNPDKQLPVSLVVNLVRELRARRPEPDFKISMYTHDWDPAESSPDSIRHERDLFETAGVQHVVVALSRTSPDEWLSAVESLARVLQM